MKTRARDILASVLREPYAWPGCYARHIVTEDGALLCTDCTRREARRIMSDIRDGYNTGWLPAGTVTEAVDADSTTPDLVSYCDHCGAAIGECC